MEEVDSYFFDTYAFYELIDGNPNYQKYSKEVSIITTILNLMELHYGLLRRGGKEEAEFYFNSFLEFVVDLDNDTIKEANEFRLLNKKGDLSYVDCIGYVLAKKRGVKFLTGDKQFEGLENVEFVK